MIESVQASNENIADAHKRLEEEDCPFECVGVEYGQPSDKGIRLITRDIGDTIQFEIAVKDGGKVYVVGAFNKWSPPTRLLNPDPDTFVFRATLFMPFGKKMKWISEQLLET